MFDFLVQFRLPDLVQDIVVGQFDSKAFTRACTLEVSFLYQKFYLIYDTDISIPILGVSGRVFMHGNGPFENAAFFVA